MIPGSYRELLNISCAATIACILGGIWFITKAIASRRTSHHPITKPKAPPPSKSLRKPFPGLPIELHEQIWAHLIRLLVEDFHLVRPLRLHRDELHRRVKQIAECLPGWQEIADRTWAAVWATRVSLWVEAYQHNIWILTAIERALPPGIDLSPLRHLHTASLNLHNGFTYNKGANTFQLLTCVAELPPSLAHLEVMYFHGPDEEIVQLAARCCPNLVELRLVRCTMFNTPTCKWWRGHPTEADHSYMRNHNVSAATEYAVANAALLQTLPKLEVLHLGDYHTHFNAIMTHRLDHKKHHPIQVQDRINHLDPNIHSRLHLNATRATEQDDGPPVNDAFPRLADRALWDVDCPACERTLAFWIRAAERRAAAVLATRVSSLHSISFASFLSDKRIRPSTWEVCLRGEGRFGNILSPEDTQELLSNGLVGSRLRVETSRAGEPRTAQSEMFVRREVGWFP